MADNMFCRDPAARDLLWRNGEPYANRSPHLGLLFERFPRLPEENGGRLTWLEDFVDFAKGPRPQGKTNREPTVLCKRRLETVHRRLDDLLKARGGETRVFATKGRLALGLGNPNAAEIGFSFDASCGLPVLPGSSVKGLARAGAELAGASEGDMPACFGRGPQGQDDGESGTVVFLDALPQGWPRFEIDIINRHHDAENLPKQKRPLDADKPNPVHFLTVASGTRFVFRLLPAQGADTGVLSNVWTWLAQALDVLGAGAKTAVGYGRMLSASN
jgi:CRISPR-associated protein Cmr6